MDPPAPRQVRDRRRPGGLLRRQGHGHEPARRLREGRRGPASDHSLRFGPGRFDQRSALQPRRPSGRPPVRCHGRRGQGLRPADANAGGYVPDSGRLVALAGCGHRVPVRGHLRRARLAHRHQLARRRTPGPGQRARQGGRTLGPDRLSDRQALRRLSTAYSRRRRHRRHRLDGRHREDSRPRDGRGGRRLRAAERGPHHRIGHTESGHRSVRRGGRAGKRGRRRSGGDRGPPAIRLLGRTRGTSAAGDAIADCRHLHQRAGSERRTPRCCRERGQPAGAGCLPERRRRHGRTACRHRLDGRHGPAGDIHRDQPQLDRRQRGPARVRGRRRLSHPGSDPPGRAGLHYQGRQSAAEQDARARNQGHLRRRQQDRPGSRSHARRVGLDRLCDRE